MHAGIDLLERAISLFLPIWPLLVVMESLKAVTAIVLFAGGWFQRYGP